MMVYFTLPSVEDYLVSGCRVKYMKVSFLPRMVKKYGNLETVPLVLLLVE